MVSLLSKAVLIVALLIPPLVAAGADEPTDEATAVFQSIQRMIAVKSEKEREILVLDLLFRKFDFEKFAERALWDQRDTVTLEERREFLRIFPQTLAKRIFSRLKNVDQVPEQFQARSLRQENGIARLRVVTFHNKAEITIDLYMIKRADAWKIFDLSINGANLTRNYQSQFNRVIRVHGVQNLLTRLKGVRL